jgi:hypothetical protein
MCATGKSHNVNKIVKISTKHTRETLERGNEIDKKNHTNIYIAHRKKTN